MATTKTVEKTEDTFFKKIQVEKIEAIAKQVWFAGIGVYGRGYDELSEQYQKSTASSQKFIEELVSRGEQVQASAESKINSGRASIEGRIDSVKSSIPKPTLPFFGEIIGKITEVETKIDGLAKEVTK